MAEGAFGFGIRPRDPQEAGNRPRKAARGLQGPPRPVREMHQACLSFLTQIGPTALPEEPDPLSSRVMAASRIRRRVLEESLNRLRRVFDARMDQLYEACGIEKPPPRGADEEA